MIYTVTFNPSLDYIINLKQLHTGAINRASQTKILGGGKGINVSIVLKNLGTESVALGFTAGFTGREITRQIEGFGCRHDFIELPAGASRINVKIKAGQETEINGQGPLIAPDALNSLFQKLEKLVPSDTLVLAGSIPNTLPDDIYENIMQKLAGKDIRIIVDATCSLLVKVLKYKPFLIKPNNHELGEIFNVTLKTTEEIILHAKKLQDLGAQNVLVSMAGDGAILLTQDQTVYTSKAPAGTVVNSVGAGDSMVAGFLAGFLETNDLLKAFRMSVATGSASAFSENLATKPEVDALLKTF